ncbi:ChrR family anti-sigma-E factor [uncultured Sneathiella sp.]|uniref:ChrR family anti-sigma-E factor n=1 Tax=uncultured Sneathiella sp. TaxID=879315 RepID=UPI0030EE8D8C|tara:strand:+ start:15629 stop:16306 length:678 start_codon:yes stop_codon:yes gene_type:complete
MTIRHHIGDDTLMAYSNGTLAESLSVVVATHLAICPKCRRSLAMMEDMAGLLLMEAEPMELARTERELADVIPSRAEQESLLAVKEAEKTRVYADTGVPKPLADRMPTSLDDIPWRTLVPGVSHFPLPWEPAPGEKGTLRLLKIAPGKTIPEHSHSGQEVTLILRGSYIDELGRFQAGDFADLDGTTNHQPVADTSEDCICLIATDAPLKFSGFFSRLLQPVFGI